MCRSIKTLRNADTPATDEDARAAALQFVRKISGYRKPPHVNTAAFNAAVDDIAVAYHKLLMGLNSTSAGVRLGQSYDVARPPGERGGRRCSARGEPSLP